MTNKLNLGAGKRHHKGYKTIDIEPYSGADIIGDFREMHFEDVEEILAEHLLEHFSRDEGIAVLNLWREWLKPGGILIVETPDFEKLCEAFSTQDKKGKYWITRHAYGSQEADWAFHRDGWYEEKYRQLFPEVGFEVLEVSRSHSRGYLPNIRVTAKKI